MNPLCINDVDDLDMTCIWPKIPILHEKRNLTHKKGKMKGDGQTFICNLEKTLYILSTEITFQKFGKTFEDQSVSLLII